MKCREFKKWVSDRVDGEIAVAMKVELDGHMAECASCRKSYEAMAQAWKVLGELPAVEPSPAFVSRFWTKVANQDARKDGFVFEWKNIFVHQRLIPAALTLSVLLIVGSLGLWKNNSVSCEISLLGASDTEFVENVELAEHLDVIKDMDWLEDLDVIEELDGANV